MEAKTKDFWVLIETNEDGSAKNVGLELLTPGEEPVAFTADEIFNTEGKQIESAPHPMMELLMPLPGKTVRLSILRKIKQN